MDEGLKHSHTKTLLIKQDCLLCSPYGVYLDDMFMLVVKHQNTKTHEKCPFFNSISEIGVWQTHRHKTFKEEKELRDEIIFKASAKIFKYKYTVLVGD